jgi:AcrR family transcriptional regulator
MPAAISSREAVLEALVGLFRDHGFAGTSIAMISEATGLGRPSLYHYFPGGKDEMAAAVVDLATQWIADNIVTPLRDRSVPLEKRVRAYLKALDAFYEGGERACLINVFALGDLGERAQPGLLTIIERWTGAMAGVAREAGATPAVAKRRAQDALVRFEGALVVARACGDRTIFARTLADIERELLDPA